MPERVLSIPSQIRLLLEWAPALHILPAIASAPAGQARAIEIVRLLEFLAAKSDVRIDDEILRMVREILLTKPGSELADYIAGLISGAISYEQSRYPGA
jgi:hypothetical protein